MFMLFDEWPRLSRRRLGSLFRGAAGVGFMEAMGLSLGDGRVLRLVAPGLVLLAAACSHSAGGERAASSTAQVVIPPADDSSASIELMGGGTPSGLHLQAGTYVVDSANGAYARRGVLEIPVDSSIIGRQIQLDLDRINLINDSEANGGALVSCANGKTYRNSFTGHNGLGLGFSNATSTLGCAAASVQTGTWFLDTFRLQSTKNELIADGLEKVLKLEAGHAIAQIIPVRAGQDYWVSFDVNTLGMYTDDPQRPTRQEQVDVQYALLDHRFQAISYWNPLENDTGSVGGGVESTMWPLATIRAEDSQLAAHRTGATSYTDSSSWVRKNVRMRTMGCGDKALYEAGSNVSTNSVTINLCNTKGAGRGVGARDEDAVEGVGPGAMFMSKMAKYAVLSFKHTVAKYDWNNCPSGAQFRNGYCYGALVDNVKVDPIEQAKIEVLDANRRVLLQSNQDKGFYLDPAKMGGTPAYVRVTLQSFGDKSPGLRSVLLTTGVDVSVSESGAMHTQPGGSGPVFAITDTDYGPFQEWDLRSPHTSNFGRDTPRTTCPKIGDPDAPLSTTLSTCTDVLQTQNMDGVVSAALWLNKIPVRWDPSVQNPDTGATGDYVVGWGANDTIGQTYNGSPMAGAAVKATAALLARALVNPARRIPFAVLSAPSWSYFVGPMVWVADQTTFDTLCASTPNTQTPAEYNATAPVMQKACLVAEYDNNNVLTGARKATFRSPTGALMPLPALRDLSNHTLNVHDQVVHIHKLMDRYNVDLFSGNTTLSLDYGTGAQAMRVPAVDRFQFDIEVNDNQLSGAASATLPAGCAEAKYVRQSLTDAPNYLCRTDALRTQCSQRLSAAGTPGTCRSATSDLWLPIGRALQSHAASQGRTIDLSFPTTNKRFNNFGHMIDVGFYDEIIPELGGATGPFTWVGTQTIPHGFYGPERLAEQHAALRSVLARHGLSDRPIAFTDVRQTNGGYYDPGCAPFYSGAVVDETKYAFPSPTQVTSTNIGSTFWRGWGHDASQKALNRLTTVGISLGTDTMYYQGIGFAQDQGLVAPYTSTQSSTLGYWGQRCWRSNPGQGLARIFHRSVSDQGLLSQSTWLPSYATDTVPASTYGENLAAIYHQIVYSHLAKSDALQTSLSVQDQRWTVDGETYHASLFRSTAQPGRHYLAIWWVPQFVYGHENAVNVGISGSRTYSNVMQYISPYIEAGYTERRLVRIALPTSIAGTNPTIKLLAPSESTGLSPLSGPPGVIDPAVEGTTVVGVPVGEQPIILTID